MGKRANVTLDEIVSTIRAGKAGDTVSDEQTGRIGRAIAKLVSKGATNAEKLSVAFKGAFPSYGSGERQSLVNDLENADLDALLSE